MHKLYACFNDKVYRMASVKDSKIKLIEAFTSQIYGREDVCEKAFSVNIKINTGEFVNKITNDQLYVQLVDYIKKMKLTGIDTLYTHFKVSIEYSLTDMNGEILDAGVIMNNMTTSDIAYMMDIDIQTNALNYRRAKLFEKKIPITRSMTNSSYGMMSTVPEKYLFTIHNIKIYGNITDEGSDYYIQNLNSCIIDKTFKKTSGTYQSMVQHNIEIFNTENYNIKFNTEEIAFRPNVIYVNMAILMDNFCAVADDGYLWSLVEENGGDLTDDPWEFPGTYDPVVNRPPHRHRPKYTNRPSCRPPYPPYPPMKPTPHPCPPCPPPNKPSAPESLLPDGMKPGNIVPTPDYNQDSGDFNEGEWCRAYDYDENKFIVVNDSISDEEFDEFTMVKYSDVVPYVSDILVGDYVKKSDTLYY